MWIIYAVLSAFFAGITSILAKIGIQKTDSNVAIAIRTCVVAVFTWIMVLLVHSQGTISSLTVHTIVFLILSGLATGASWLCYFRALQIGDVNKVVPIDKCSTILTLILAFMFLGEKISVEKGAGMIFILIGTFLMIQPKKQTEEKSADWRWLLYAIGSAVFAALTSILGKIGIAHVESNLGTAIRTIVVLVMSWMMVLIMGKAKEVRDIEKKELFFICISGIATGASWLCYYKALQGGLVHVVVSIDKLSIVVTIGFSVLILKEKITKKALAGLLLNIAGTLCMIG